MDVGEICTREVVTVTQDQTVLDAARRMREAHVGALIVVDGVPARPVGVLTDRDIAIGIVAQDAVDLPRLLVGDVLVHDPDELVTVFEGDSALWTAWQMRDAGVRRVPVVNEDGALVGILTMDDLLAMFVEQLGDLVALIRGQQLKERRERPG